MLVIFGTFLLVDFEAEYFRNVYILDRFDDQILEGLVILDKEYSEKERSERTAEICSIYI